MGGAEGVEAPPQALAHLLRVLHSLQLQAKLKTPCFHPDLELRDGARFGMKLYVVYSTSRQKSKFCFILED